MRRRHVPQAVDPAEIARMRDLADLLDSRWRIPGTGIRFGLDGIASLVPVVGDSLTAVISAGIVVQAWRLGIPAPTLARMVGNVGIDWLFGSIPVIGTIFDVAFKSNSRNMALLRQHLDTFEDLAAERQRVRF